MLSRKLCPYTGIVNYFEKSEPHVAVGMTMPVRGKSNYFWLSFVGDGNSFTEVVDLTTAERQLAQHNRAATARAVIATAA